MIAVCSVDLRFAGKPPWEAVLVAKRAGGSKSLAFDRRRRPRYTSYTAARIFQFRAKDLYLRRSSLTRSPCSTNCLRAMQVITLPGSVTMI
jgi:hypothetical protein